MNALLLKTYRYLFVIINLVVDAVLSWEVFEIAYNAFAKKSIPV